MIGMNVGDEGGKDGVDVADDFFRAPSRAQFAAQGSRQGGEAGDIGEKRGACDAIRQVFAFV